MQLNTTDQSKVRSPEEIEHTIALLQSYLDKALVAQAKLTEAYDRLVQLRKQNKQALQDLEALEPSDQLPEDAILELREQRMMAIDAYQDRWTATVKQHREAERLAEEEIDRLRMISHPLWTKPMQVREAIYSTRMSIYVLEWAIGRADCAL